MSGHSKWSSIKHKKGAADAKRGKLFSKLSRAIIVAAREGGPDPEANATLATAIQKARDNSMPKDNIERAIARGAGAGGDGDAAYEPVTYEGYGPGGVAVFVEALTDNRNRTAAEVRHIFTKHDGNLGTSGAVAWLFERKGVVIVPAGDGRRGRPGASPPPTPAPRTSSSDGSRASRSRPPPDGLAAVREALEAAGIAYESAELTMLPKTTVAVEDESTAKKLLQPHGRARGERRRPGRLRELRHPRGDTRSGRGLRTPLKHFAGPPWTARCVVLGRARISQRATQPRTRRRLELTILRQSAAFCRISRPSWNRIGVSRT